ncbi:MAG: formate dehydrogenase accessory sulfurtransferase FdhD [Candidatus Nanopelagicaceae bacterium]|nr:formate dehydrogenase accessory sulfurtransferase FdhD [Candidatus Nanopelagicaceae bacterium]
MLDDESAPSSIARVKVQATDTGEVTTDSVVVEEPLEIRIKRGGIEEQLGITMRTPGSDLELTAGFLWGEGFLNSPNQLLNVKSCGDKSFTPRQRANITIAQVSDDAPVYPRSMDRRFTMTSACGVCGSTSMADLHKRGVKPVIKSTRDIQTLASMTAFLEGRQSVFEKTGGLHAALLVDPNGEPKWIREDVGRHNAVDKVNGAALMAGQLPLHDWTLVVSGRVGYEIVQKAIVAGISALVGVSAPTSLAVDLAFEFNLTLLAFARNGKAKVYLPLLG